MLKRLNRIDRESKYAVSGFVRKYQVIIESAEYNLFNNIPILIRSLCTLYYDPSDNFEGNKDVILSSDNKSILGISEESDFATCRGRVIISSKEKCKAKWDLKMLNIPSDDETVVLVGVADIDAVFCKDLNGNAEFEMKGE